jgi:alcohol dehydrogenase
MLDKKEKAAKILKEWKKDSYVFGVGVLNKVGEYASKFGKKTILVVTQYQEKGGEWLIPFLNEIADSLKKNNLSFSQPIRGAKPNAPREDMYRIALETSKRKPDSIIAIGGGSTIDAVKAASVLATYESSDIEPYFGVGEVSKVAKQTNKPLIPVIAVQTAASSGAHLTKYANITDPVTGIKKLIVDEAIIPPAAVFDYKTTLNTPLPLTQDGALDGIAHCWEVFMGATGKIYYDEIKEITETCVSLILECLPKILKKTDDLEARTGLGLATDLGGYAIMISKKNPTTGQVESGGTNGGHLGSFQLVDYLPHGRACAILNPYYTLLFAEKIINQNITIGKLFQQAGYIDEKLSLQSMEPKELAYTVATGMLNFLKKINYPSTLKEAGVPERQIEVMVEASKNPQLKSKLQNMPLPIDVEKGDVDRLIKPTLQAAYTGNLEIITSIKKQ